VVAPTRSRHLPHLLSMLNNCPRSLSLGRTIQIAFLAFVMTRLIQELAFTAVVVGCLQREGSSNAIACEPHRQHLERLREQNHRPVTTFAPPPHAL